MSEDFHLRLRALRKQRNLSSSDLAKKANIPLSTYREWENGRKIVGEQAYIALSQVLQVSLHQLIVGEISQEQVLLEGINFIEEKCHEMRTHLLSLKENER